MSGWQVVLGWHVESGVMFIIFVHRVTATTVKGLQTGATYSFRVRGENAAGLGEPSKPTKPTVIEEQPCLTE